MLLYQWILHFLHVKDPKNLMYLTAKMFSSRDPPEANVGVKNDRLKNIYSIFKVLHSFFWSKIADLQAHSAAPSATRACRSAIFLFYFKCKTIYIFKANIFNSNICFWGVPGTKHFCGQIHIHFGGLEDICRIHSKDLSYKCSL